MASSSKKDAASSSAGDVKKGEWMGKAGDGKSSTGLNPDAILKQTSTSKVWEDEWANGWVRTLEGERLGKDCC